MGKDTRAGRNSSHHIQLALFPRYIACMDRRGHHLFQGTLQVPLPYSLFSRGTGHHSVHTEFLEKPRDFDPFGQTGLPPLATI